MQDVHKAIDEAITQMKEGTKPTFTLISHEELLNLDVPPMKWVMNMLIPNPGLVVLSGKPGSYKTFFAQWLGLRASSGLPLFDEYDEPYFAASTNANLTGKIPTLFVEEENTKQTMKQRAHGFKPSEINDMYYTIDQSFSFSDQICRDQLQKIIQEKQIKLLILDPFSSVMGLENENDNAEVAKIMDTIRKEFVSQGMTVVLIHHPSKGDGAGKNIRGAGDILGKCDVHLCLEVENEQEHIIRISYEKLRIADRAKVANFTMRLIGDSDLRDQRFRYLCVAKSKTEIDRDKLAAEIMEILEDGKEYTKKEIAEMVEQKPANDKFKATWKQLESHKKVLMNSMTKKYHRDESKNCTTPF